MLIKNTALYDFLKFLGRYILPALATLITSVFDVWGIPYGAEIATTLMAVDTFLNVLLGISNENYNKAEESPVREDHDFAEWYDDDIDMGEG